MRCNAPAPTRRPTARATCPGSKAAGKVAAIGAGVSDWRWATRSARSCPAAATPNTSLCPGRARAAGARGDGAARGRLPAGDLLHRLVQRVHARRPRGRRTLPRPRRLVRDRHHRDPARQCLRRAGVHHRRLEGEMRGLRDASGRSGRSTTATRISSRCCSAEGGADLILDMVGGAYIAAQHPGAGRRRADGAHRLPRRPQGRAELRPDHGPAADLDRLDAAAAVERSPRRGSPRSCARRSGRCSTPAGSRR